MRTDIAVVDSRDRMVLKMPISGISEEPAASIFRVEWFLGILFKTRLQSSLQK
jgi:hypothetical protein